MDQSLPVAIIGAGPVGLAAAAHLSIRHQPFILFEMGNTVACNLLSWKHIRLFSPWRYTIDKAARYLLLESGWESPDDEGLPIGEELYAHYLKPLSEVPTIKPFLHLGSRVLSVGRRNMDKLKSWGREELPYLIHVQHTGNEIKQYEAKAVIDATGTWNFPNPIGSGGVPAAGELENSKKIFYGIPDILNKNTERYKNKSVLVVGSGHSSINVILELDRLREKYPATEIHWALRKKNVQDVYGGQEKDSLAARGALGIKIEQLVLDDHISVYTPFHIQQIINNKKTLTIIGYDNNILKALPNIDEIISNTGSRPDFSFVREVRLNIDPTLESVAQLAALIDPYIHSCGTVRPHGEQELRHPDKDFYIVGSKSYGRAPTFLLATGYEQVRSIAAAIDGDMESAQNVELDLPETGVCNVDVNDNNCCGKATSQNQGLKNVTASCC